VEGAGNYLKLCRHTCIAQAHGVVDVLIMKQVRAPGPDPREWKSRQVVASGRCRVETDSFVSGLTARYSLRTSTEASLWPPAFAGTFGINQGYIMDPLAPFGGTKHSGYGRELGREGLEAFVDTKSISMTSG